MIRTRRWAARAALLSVAAAAGTLGAAAPAFAIGGGFDPVASPPVFPGTQTPVDAWKLTGTGGADGSGGATSVQIAPRWLLSSQHGGMTTGLIYTSPLGQRSKVIDYAEPAQDLAIATLGHFNADISLSLLETPIAEPAGGFPALLTEPLTRDLLSALPGSVFWSGQGGSPVRPVPTVAWGRPDGLPSAVGPTFNIVPFDSGSAGFLMRAPGARPLYAGVNDYGAPDGTDTYPSFGGDTRITSPLAPSGTENYPTIQEWLKAQLAKHPEAAPPSFATFAQAGMALTSLKPPAPREIAQTAAAPTSVSLRWDAPTELRIPLTSYRVHINPSGRVVSVPATQTTAVITGLSPETDYTFTVRAANANGESSMARRQISLRWQTDPVSLLFEPESVSYRVRENPGAVRGLTFTAGRFDGAYTTAYGGSPGLDYCVTAQWDASIPGAGSTVDRYETTLNGVVMDQGYTDISAVPGPDGKLFARRCGLQPGSAHSFSVRAFSGLNAGPASAASTTVPDGAPLGTSFGAATAVVSPTRRAVKLANVDYCTTTTWQAPAPIAGAPVTGYEVRVSGNAGSFQASNLPATTRSRSICGLEASSTYTATVTAVYGGIVTPRGLKLVDLGVRIRTPTGAPRGTPLGAPQEVALTARYGNAAGTVDYCVNVTWTAPEPVDGFPLADYEVLFASNDSSYSTWVKGIAVGAGQRSREFCGLKPGVAYNATAFARYPITDAVNAWSAAEPVEATTPAGAAPGTPWARPAGVAVVLTTEGTQLCATVSWQAPALAPGMAAPSGYFVLLQTSTYVAGSDDLSGSTRSFKQCGIPRGRSVKAAVSANYAPMVSVTTTAFFSTPLA